MVPPLSPSLSTMWMQHRSDRLVAWWETVRRLGFAHIELSSILTTAMMADVTPGMLPVRSVHVPVPVITHPDTRSSPDELLSSPDEDRRQWAVAQARRTIDLAATLGAQAVCVHLGRVDLPRHLEWVVYQRYAGGYRDTPVYRQALERLLAARRQAAAPYLAAARRSLAELARYAETAGIRLGIETRLHVDEIPNRDEAALLLAEQDPAVVGLWYDCGHVQVQAHLGLTTPTAWLETLGSRIVAAHLHDVRGLRDHLVPRPGGAVDFALLAAHLPATALRVCEFDWYFEPEEIVAAVAYLAASGCCHPLTPTD